MLNRGVTLPSHRISKSWSSWRTRGWGQCVTVWVSLDQSSKPCCDPIGSASQTQEGVRNAIYECPTTSRGWVGITHLMCARGWHLLFPLAASKLQLSFHWFQEDGRENARQPEIMRHGINWRSRSSAFPSTTCRSMIVSIWPRSLSPGSCRTGQIKKGERRQ